MDNQEQLQKLLERMEQNSRKQLIYSRIQCVFSIVAGICCVILLINILEFMPQLQLLTEQASQVLTNLEEITAQLQKLDVAAMIDNINALTETSREGLEEALGKLNEINFDVLNQAIEDLADVVEPMAEFINRITLGGRL